MTAIGSLVDVLCLLLIC